MTLQEGGQYGIVNNPANELNIQITTPKEDRARRCAPTPFANPLTSLPYGSPLSLVWNVSFLVFAHHPLETQDGSRFAV